MAVDRESGWRLRVGRFAADEREEQFSASPPGDSQSPTTNTHAIETTEKDVQAVLTPINCLIVPLSGRSATMGESEGATTLAVLGWERWGKRFPTEGKNVAGDLV